MERTRCVTGKTNISNHFTSAAAVLAGLMIGMPGFSARADVISQTNLLSNGSVPAANVNADVVNPWGVSYSPTGPFWISDNGNGLSTLNNGSGVFNTGLIVQIPSASGPQNTSSPTGQVFNSVSTAFMLSNAAPARFIFATEQGTIAAWNGGTTATTMVNNAASGAVYKGLAEATTPTGSTLLYAANFNSGHIDVFNSSFGSTSVPGGFLDPNLPAGYAPFNIQKLGNILYVTFAQQDPTKQNEVAGAGKGYVDAFDLNGNLLGRIASGGVLNAPWGLDIAPTTFGAYAGDLLVGNFGDGTIDAFNPVTDQFIGQLLAPDGNILSIDGLWALINGNGGNAGSTANVYFTAGPNGETGGLFGSLTDVPEPASMTLLLGGAGLTALLRRRRSVRAGTAA